MSQESSKVIARQWQIIQFLLEGKYVSTSDVETYLKTKNIEATQRTIQRDLNLLETLFPLECRRDCMPYSWRWKKVEQSVKGLTLSQALLIRLMDEELKNILPVHIQQELSPLFQKARLFSSHSSLEEIDTILFNRLDRKYKDDQGFGLHQPSLLNELQRGIADKFQTIYEDIFKIEEKETKLELNKLSLVLESNEMPELASLLMKKHSKI